MVAGGSAKVAVPPCTGLPVPDVLDGVVLELQLARIPIRSRQAMVALIRKCLDA
jgi:hypothetical protein